jgi:hypothetical protein
MAFLPKEVEESKFEHSAFVRPPIDPFPDSITMSKVSCNPKRIHRPIIETIVIIPNMLTTP